MEPKSATPRDLRERTRMWQLVFAIWVSCANGATYGIGGYLTPVLKKAPYNMSQSQLSLISAVTGVAVSISLPAGFVYDRYGSAMCLRIGAIFAFIGAGMTALMYHGYIHLSVPTLMVSGSISAFSYGFFETGTFVTNLAMFARDKGTLLLVEQGVGSAILSSWYTGFMDKDDLLLVTLAPFALPAVALAASLMIAKPVIDEELIPWHGHARFAPAYVTVGMTLGVFAATDVVRNFVHVSRDVYLGLGVFGAAALLSYALLPIVLNDRGYKEPHANASFLDLRLFADEPEPTPTWNNGQLDGQGCLQANLQPAREEAEDDGERLRVNSNDTRRDVTLWQTIQTPEIWLLFAMSTVQWGVTNVIDSNRPQIYQALNNGVLVKSTNALYISVASIFNAVGRCAVALIDRRVRNKSAIMALAPPLFVLTATIIAILPVEGLIAGFIFSSFADSVSWSARSLVLKQLFNGKHFGLIYNFMFSLAIASPFIFNVAMFSPLYDAEARRLGTYPNCPERSCIQPQMYILIGVSLVGSLGGVVPACCC